MKKTTTMLMALAMTTLVHANEPNSYAVGQAVGAIAFGQRTNIVYIPNPTVQDQATMYSKERWAGGPQNIRPPIALIRNINMNLLRPIPMQVYPTEPIRMRMMPNYQLYQPWTGHPESHQQSTSTVEP